MGVKLDIAIRDTLLTKLNQLERHLNSDVIFFYGSIQPSIEKPFRDFIEKIKLTSPGFNKLTIILNTYGGSAEIVEKMVEITRHHYPEVEFIVPDYALSAGTIFCMSGDKIWMDYSSSLGPIDPQIYNGTRWLPALGYLDKVNEFIEKSKDNILTQAEYLMLKEQDLAMLRSYEQARDLTIQLLKNWLVQYKFKNWNTHKTNPDLLGQVVTYEQKEERAEDIARLLGDNKRWHSHGRLIGIDTLKTELKLEIEDYSSNVDLRPLIRDYNDIICDYIVRIGLQNFLHSKVQFFANDN